MRAEDKASWSVLWQAYLDFYGETLTPRINALTWQRMLNQEEPLHGVAAFHAGKMVGFAHTVFHRSTWADTNYCYLEDLFVSPAARGLGAGRALIEAARTNAQAAGARRLYWVTRRDNENARHLYDKVANESGFLQYRMTL